MSDSRRQLPSVDRLLHQPAIQELLQIAPRGAVVAAVRESIEAARTRRAGPPEHWEQDVRERLSRRGWASLQPALNATGVVLHTNLGRAPLAEAAPGSPAVVALHDPAPLPDRSAFVDVGQLSQADGINEDVG